jgi:hypothetical protein
MLRSRLATAAALLALALAPAAHAAQSRALVFMSDYNTGSLSSADVQPRAMHCDIASVSTDAGLRYYGDRLYVLNRFGSDNVQEIDPATGATLKEFSVGAGSNPHDIAFASDTKAYVTRYETTKLWVVNPVSGAKTGEIDLGPLADSDGIPEMDRMATVGPYLFVSLNRVDRNNGYAPDDSGLVAVVDMRADTLVDCDPAHAGVQGIHLQLTNPFTAFQWDPASGRLLIGCFGAYNVPDGGVERIDPVALAADGVVITGAALGGDVDGIVWGDAAKSWAIVADPAGNTKLVSWSATSGTVLSTLWAPGGYDLTDAELNDRGELWVCQHSLSTPRVRVFSAATGLQTGSDLVCLLPPVTLAFDSPSGLGLGVPRSPVPLAFAPPAPSPAARATRLAFTLAAPAWLRVEIFDAAGRRVRTLADGAWPAGRGSMEWDLADDSGARVAPGVYPVRARAGGAEWKGRVIVTR